MENNYAFKNWRKAKNFIDSKRSKGYEVKLMNQHIQGDKVEMSDIRKLMHNESIICVLHIPDKASVTRADRIIHERIPEKFELEYPTQ